MNIYSRRKTTEVKVGNIGIGGTNPIRIQSMTNTDTMNTKETVLQVIRMIEAGCELIRITAPTVADAENLLNIKNELNEKGFYQPLIADIHYSAKAAEIAARIVSKVRINPGNYADKKQFKQLLYTENEYLFELERIAERIKPLINICKDYGTAIRIGVNHGSLSDRIISRYGDTPHGMAMSAIEYAEICNSLGFKNLIFSMKSSDVKTMIYSTRLLVNLMQEKEYYFPIHIGVTEAGSGEDGRIRSAAGIGALLEDGIGDTIRVSLTEDPVKEIPVAAELVKKYNNAKINFVDKIDFKTSVSPFEYKRRSSFAINKIGGENKTVVINPLIEKNIEDIDINKIDSKIVINLNDKSENVIDCKKIIVLNSDFEIPISEVKNYIKNNLYKNQLPIVIQRNYNNLSELEVQLVAATEISYLAIDGMAAPICELKNYIKNNLYKNQLPIIIQRNYNNLLESKIQLIAATEMSYLAIDGMADGIYLTSNLLNNETLYKLSLDILQACGLRYYKTEFISCPSCGRTLFDIETVLLETKTKLSQFKGLKIAVMGCIVNGPGEMSDADYGLVGAGEGKVWLYKGKTPIKKDINQSNAVDELIKIINEKEY